jgi:hypothetical protein
MNLPLNGTAMTFVLVVLSLRGVTNLVVTNALSLYI